MHDGAVGLGDASCLRGAGSLGEVTAGHDHVPVAALTERLGCGEAQPRGGPRDDHLPGAVTDLVPFRRRCSVQAVAAGGQSQGDPLPCQLPTRYHQECLQPLCPRLRDLARPQHNCSDTYAISLGTAAMNNLKEIATNDTLTSSSPTAAEACRKRAGSKDAFQARLPSAFQFIQSFTSAYFPEL